MMEAPEDIAYFRRAQPMKSTFRSPYFLTTVSSITSTLLQTMMKGMPWFDSRTPSFSDIFSMMSSSKSGFTL